jgi:hypothetical protein
MDWELIFQGIQALAVLIGVIFGLIQLRHIREQREIQAGVELLDPLQAPSTAETLLLLHAMPNGLSPDELRQHLGDRLGDALATMSYFEALGPLVARGYIPIGMYAEFYRGPTTIVWRKLRPYVEEQRAAGWPHLFEWLQWLAERMAERPVQEVPAFIRCKDWKSPRDYRG